MKKVLFCTLYLLFTFSLSYGAVYQLELEVGESSFIALPDAPNNGYIYEATFGCDNVNISISSESVAGAIIKIDEYFSGTATVEAWYGYEYTYKINNKRWNNQPKSE